MIKTNILNNYQSFCFKLQQQRISKIQTFSFEKLMQQMSASQNKMNQIQQAGRRKGVYDLSTCSKSFCMQPPKNENVFKKFQLFAEKQYLKRIKDIFKNAHGRHIPINYDKQFGFRQQWQIFKKQKCIENEKDNKLFFIYALVLVTVVSVCIWSLSTSLVFQWENRKWIYEMIVFLNIMEICAFFWYKKEYLNPKEILIKSCKQLAILLICGIEIIFQSSIPYEITFILALITIVYLYAKASKRYEDIKIFHISSLYRTHINLFDLFFTLICINHIFALALYAVAKLHSHSNWMIQANIQNQDWLTKYIYASYFSCTTLLTVGYGDLSPTNTDQILIILGVEIIGIALFAYTVSQIGGAISKMKEKKEKMQKNLNNVQNMGNIYQLDSGVLYRMRNEVKNNKEILNRIRLDEQTQLLNKFSDDLREQINFQVNIKIVKRSAFMLANWTGSMQAKIAKKLIKQIYYPEEPLIQVAGQEKLFIIGLGRINIMTNSFNGEKSSFKQVLKTLEANKQKQIQVKNVFGYSSVISDRQVRLSAVSKSLCICYTLQKKYFIECLSQSELDLQNFHELKLKIDLAKIAEEIQAPRVSNIREHYNPTSHYVISNNKRPVVNERSWKSRRSKRFKEVIFNPDRQKLDFSEIKRKTLTFKEIMEGRHFPEARISFITTMLDIEQTENNAHKLNNYFESAKQYQRYFKKMNYQQVIARLSSRNSFSTSKVNSHTYQQ